MKKNLLINMLELESGSNDPCAYMLTIIILGLMSNGGYSNILPMMLKQVIVGIVVFFFKLISKIIADKSHYIYQITKDNIIYIIITFIIIIGFACLMYYLHKNIPHCKGGGIPRSEGYLRGELKFNSLKLNSLKY